MGAIFGQGAAELPPVALLLCASHYRQRFHHLRHKLLLVLCHISVELIEEDLENAASIEAAWVSETTLLAG